MEKRQQVRYLHTIITNLRDLAVFLDQHFHEQILFSIIMMSYVMAGGKVFSRMTSYPGIIGNSLMVIYIILVTFIPAVEKLALAFSMLGGLLVMAWMIMFTMRLFKLIK